MSKCVFIFWDSIMPVFTLFLGMLFIPLVESIKEKHRLKKLKKYIILNLRLLQEQIEQQSKEINERIIGIEDFKINDIIPVKVSLSSLKCILKTDESDIYKLLVNMRKGKEEDLEEDYKDVVNCVNYFSETLKPLFETCQNAAVDINMFSDDWNKSQMRFQDIINESIMYNAKNGIERKNDSFLNKIIILREDLAKRYGDQAPNIEVTFLEYVNPVIELSIEYAYDRRALFLLQESQKSKLAYEQLKVTRKRIKKYVQLTYENIIKTYKKLTRVLESINNDNL